MTRTDKAGISTGLPQENQSRRYERRTMTKSAYFTIEELAERWTLKPVDVWEKIIKDKIPRKTDNPEDMQLEAMGFRRLRPIGEVKERNQARFISKKDVEQYEKRNPELTKGLPDLTNHHYLFRKEGPTWKIVFEGRPLKGLKGKGFLYIHFLVSNSPGVYRVADLADLDPAKPDTGDLSNKSSFSHQDIHDSKARHDYREKYKELQEELGEAETNHDLGRREKVQRDMDLLRHEIKINKHFGNETQKARDRIAANIKRAIKEMKKWDIPAAQHFEKALKPIKSFNLSYEPDATVRWNF